MTFFFAERSQQTELMDGENISYAEFAQCLKELTWINRLTLAYRPTLNWLKYDVPWHRHQSAPIAILDVGSGSGDMLRRIARWTQRNNQSAVFTGVDLNPHARKLAMTIKSPVLSLRFVTANVFSFPIDRLYDVIISSLFTHHLTNDEIIHFIRWMNDHAKIGWFINDLHRHCLPYLFIKSAVRLFSRNRLIRHDAPVSVARSFTRQDWLKITQQAGLKPEKLYIRWHFPFRYSVSYSFS